MPTQFQDAACVPTSPLLRVAALLGGLSGLTGVALLAAAAHLDTTGLLEKAGEMLLFHAPVLFAMGLLSQVRKAPLLGAALLLLVIGLSLFCGDMVMRAEAGHHLFSMAAPSGGIAIMVSWLVFAFAGIGSRPVVSPID